MLGGGSDYFVGRDNLGDILWHARPRRQPVNRPSSRYSRRRTQDGVTVEHVKWKGSPYSITERWVPELIPVLGSQPAVDASHKPGGRLPLLSARPAVTPALNP